MASQKMVDLSGQSWNFSKIIKELDASLDEVLARPLKIRVITPRQRQRRTPTDLINQAIADYQAGQHIKQIAKRYEVHRTTVVGWLNANHVPLRTRGLAELELPEAIRLYLEGWSLMRLADHFDCGAETIRKNLKQAGVPLRRPWERGNP